MAACDHEGATTAISDLTDTKAVLQAIKEFDVLGLDRFIKKYDFGTSQNFFLLYEGKRYDSKAILGAAYGYIIQQNPGLVDDLFDFRNFM